MTVSFKDLQLIYGVAGAREKFEQLCSLLIKTEHPEAVGIRVYKGDGGVDTSVGDWNSTGQVLVFQQKFFIDGIGDSQKNQIREAFLAARNNENFQLKEWILCLPIDLSQEEKKWFDDWKSKQDVPIEHWGDLHLTRLLLKPENRQIKEEFFRQEYLSQIREIHRVIIAIANNIVSRLDGVETHDVVLFRTATEKLLGRKFQDFLNTLLDEAAYDKVDYTLITGYQNWSAELTNCYLDQELQDLQNRFNQSLGALTSFIGFHFFTRGDLLDGRMYLHPDLNPDYGDYSLKASGRFQKFYEELETHVNGALQHYSALVTEGKRNLHSRGLL